MRREIINLATVLYQACGGRLYRLLPETLASQVRLSDGVDVQTRLLALERGLAANTTTHICDNIGQRDGILNKISGDRCFVSDASGDPAIAEGSAMYIWLVPDGWKLLWSGQSDVNLGAAVGDGLYMDKSGRLCVEWTAMPEDVWRNYLPDGLGQLLGGGLKAVNGVWQVDWTAMPEAAVRALVKAGDGLRWLEDGLALQLGHAHIRTALRLGHGLAWTTDGLAARGLALDDLTDIGGLGERLAGAGLIASNGKLALHAAGLNAGQKRQFLHAFVGDGLSINAEGCLEADYSQIPAGAIQQGVPAGNGLVWRDNVLHVNMSDAVDSSLAGVAATCTAVKTVYDLASAAANNASQGLANAAAAMSAAVAAGELAAGSASAAEKALATADNASDRADEAQATADGAASRANTAQSAASAAQSTADQANATATQASTDAATAQATADSAMAKANTAQATADGKVSKAGDTVSGPLILAENNYLYNSQLDINTNPSASLYNQITAWDKNKIGYGAVRFYQTADGIVTSDFYARNNKEDGTSIANILGLRISKERSFGVSPDPIENTYASQIDTLRASINRHPIKLTASKNIYVGGANASDTANLFQGRGESADKPFATLAAAVNWVRNHYVGNYDVNIILQADMSMPAMDFYMNNIASLRLMGDSTQRTITSGSWQIRSGSLRIGSNLKFVNNGGRFFFAAQDFYHAACSVVFEADTEFSGNVTEASIEANWGGVVRINGVNITGAVTGKRYSCMYGGRIFTGGKGPNAIPGSVAGTCDEASLYY